MQFEKLYCYCGEDVTYVPVGNLRKGILCFLVKRRFDLSFSLSFSRVYARNNFEIVFGDRGDCGRVQLYFHGAAKIAKLDRDTTTAQLW